MTKIPDRPDAPLEYMGMRIAAGILWVVGGLLSIVGIFSLFFGGWQSVAPIAGPIWLCAGYGCAIYRRLLMTADRSDTQRAVAHAPPVASTHEADEALMARLLAEERAKQDAKG